jgi:hypothetical protein
VTWKYPEDYSSEKIAIVIFHQPGRDLLWVCNKDIFGGGSFYGCF